MLNKISIKNKMILLMVIPIFSILFFSGRSVLTDYTKLNELNSLEIAVQLTTKVSTLVHETQKERGATAGFLGSKGIKFKKTLSKQRMLTNKRVKELKEFLEANNIKDISQLLYNVLNKALLELNKIEQIRKNVSALTISGKNAISYYTNMNALFLSIVIESSKISTSPTITKQLVAYSNFLLSKERAGIERAVGSNTLAQDYFSEGMRIKFNNLIASQNSYMKIFLEYASLDAKKFYDKTLRGKAVDEVSAIRKVLLSSANKQMLVSSMKESVGYGGLIHNFKNYVIRGTLSNEAKVREKYKKLISKINKYKTFDNVSKKEIQLLADVSSVFEKYHNGLNNITASKNKITVKNLDKIVKVNDAPAVKALNALGMSLFSVESKYWFDIITQKINLLKKIDDYLSLELIKSIDKEYNNASKNFYLVSVFSILSILLVLVFSFLIVKSITISLVTFREGLLSFFKYINKQTNEIKFLDDSNRGEIGHMASVINENIKKVQENIEEEKDVIKKTIEVLKEFEQGDLSQRVNIKSSNVALDELTSLLDNMAYNIQKNIDNVLNILEEYSSYNYMNKIDNSNIKAHLKKLANGVNELGSSITNMLVDSKKVGTKLNKSSVSLLKNVDVLNQSSSQAAASLEETSASLEEITGTIVNNADAISKMSSNASSLDKATKEGEHLANKTMEAMVEINDQVTLINESISIIDQIAFQTNILSLNAAVEAATAGEAGKGFAVVAAEVRNLASRSAEAAKEIKEIVEKANDKAGDGKSISNKMIEGYSHLNSNIKETITLIKDVETSSSEQRLGIEQINSAINMQDRQTQEIASAASQTYDIATNTSSLSTEIVDNANKKEFKGKDEII